MKKLTITYGIHNTPAAKTPAQPVVVKATIPNISIPADIFSCP